MNNIASAQLFQSRPANTTAVTLITASQVTEITRLFIANTTGTAATFRLYHDDDGTTMDQTTALYYDVSVAANTTLDIFNSADNGGIVLKKDGTLGFATGTGNALTITGYGRVWAGR